MVVLNIDCYEVSITFLVRKKDWDDFNDGHITVANVEDRVQSGVEIPFEKIDIKIKK